MNCTLCDSKVCRTGISCNKEKYDIENVIEEFQSSENQKIIQAAAHLVDGGKAGTLSRMDEIIEFVKRMRYKKVGLAYCYGMESDAIKVGDIFKNKGIKLQTISCSVSGILQDEINQNSCIHKISCNPIGQARQLNAENVDFVIIMGICLGHDILLQKNLEADFTVFVVKDRVNKHNPLQNIYNTDLE
jgi:uncharacterized metal-binding protein